MNIGDVIEKIKWEGRLNQQQIADVLGCRQSTISRIKNLKQVPSLQNAQKIVILAKKYKIKVKLEDIFTS